MNTPTGVLTDHKNHNGLDNRKANLRNATHGQNQHNRSPEGATSAFKGVCWNKRAKKWEVRICLNRRTIYLGRFVDEERAARAYDTAARQYHGEFAVINLPEII